MNTQHQTPIQGTAMAPRLKPTERQTLGAVQSVNQTPAATLANRAEMNVDVADDAPIDAVANMPKHGANALPQLETSEQFAAAVKGAFKPAAMVNLRWFGGGQEAIADNYYIEQTMSPKYQATFEPIQFDWDY